MSDDLYSYEDEPPVIEGRDAQALLDADDHLRRRAFWQTRLDEAEKVYHCQLDRLNEWWAAEKQRIGRHIDWHDQTVTSLHAALLADDPKRKTIHLPHGTLRARKLPDRVEADPAVTLPWLLEHRADLLRHEIDKPSLNRAVKAGLEVPGVAVTPGEVRFSVDTNLDAGEDPT
jgi:hypothetical protein